MGRNNPIEEFLLSAQVMIENSLNDGAILAALTVYGFASEKLMMGKNLYDQVIALHNAQKKESGDQVAATAELNEAWSAANLKYVKALKIARVALKDNVRADKSIMLHGPRNQSLSGWLEQTQAFYGNLLKDNELTAALTQYGYPRAKLAEEKALVDQVSAKNLQQKREIGEAQEATESRDKKLDELAKWISDLKAVAKVALAESPQQLEKLGIVVRKK